MRKIIKITELYNKQNKLCKLCGLSLENEYGQLTRWLEQVKYNNTHPENPVKIRPKRTKIDIDIDHVIPKSKNGSNDLDNLSVTHIHCNKSKGNN